MHLEREITSNISSVLMGNDIVNAHIICVDMRHFLDIKPEVVFCFKHPEAVKQ